MAVGWVRWGYSRLVASHQWGSPELHLGPVIFSVVISDLDAGHEHIISKFVTTLN